MTYALFFSDVHIHGKNAFSAPTEEGFTTLLDQKRESLLWVAQQILDRAPYWVGCLGDVGHVPGVLDAASLRVIVECFSAVQKACARVKARFVCLVGNHDMYFADGMDHKTHSLHFLDEDVLVASPRVIERDAPSPWRGRILGLPYTKDHASVEAALLDPKAQEVDFALLHTDALGACWNQGYPAKIGVRTGVAVQAGFPVFNGHHHHPEVKEDGRWVQVGSLTAGSFNDSWTERPRGITLLALDGSVTQVANPHTDHFYTVRSGDDFDLLGKMSPEDRLRLHLKVRGTPTELAVSRQHLDPKEFKSLKLVPSAAKRTLARLEGITASSTPEEVFRAYAQKVGDVSEEVVDLAIELLESVRPRAVAASPATFLSAHGKNFTSYVQLDVDFAGFGLKAITGENLDAQGADKNGAGKTTYSGGLLSWVLWGRTPGEKPLRNSAVIRRGESAVRGEVLLERDGQEYRVTRAFVGSSGSLKIECGDDDITPHLRADAEKLVAEIVGLTEAEFSQVCFLDLSKRFMVLGDTEKKDVIESFSETPSFALAFAAAAELKKTERLAVLYASEDRARTAAHARLAERSDMIRTLRQRASTIRASTLQSRANADVLVGRLQTSVIDAARQEQGSTERLAQLDADPRSRASEYLPLLTKKAREARERAEHGSRFHMLDKQQLKTLESLAGGSCPTCKRPTDSAHEHQARLPAFAAIVESRGRMAVQDAEYAAQTERSLADAQTTYQAWVSERNAAARDLQQATSDRARLQAELDRALVPSSEEEEARQLGAQADAMETEVPQLEQAASDAEQRTQALRERIELLDALAFHLGPQGVRSYALDRCLDRLNQHLLEYSHAFGGDFLVSIAPERSNKEGGKLQKVTVLVEPGSYESCSSGERTRVDLIVQFALRALREDNIGAPTFFVVDDCDRGMDYTGLAALVSILEEMTETRVFFVTQNTLVKNLVQDTITVVKKGGVSRLVEAV